ncbi:serine/arginine repetitive matrix protein 1, partial [Ixodes scapularis]
REVSSFVCQSCAKINGGARPNVSGAVSGGPDDQFARSPPPPSASPTRPATLPASSPDGLDARGDASLQSLRSLLLDALEGISFLTEEVASLSEDNARLRREQRQQAELQAGSIACLRAEVRSLRDVLGKRARTDVEVQAGPCGGKTFAAALRFPPASALSAKPAGAPADGTTKDDALPGKPNPMSPQAPASALSSVFVQSKLSSKTIFASVDSLGVLSAKLDELLALGPTVECLQTTVKDVETSIGDFSAKYNSPLTLATANNQTVKALQAEVSDLQAKVSPDSQATEILKIRTEQNDSEQYSRLANMELHGLPTSPGENLAGE